MGGHLRMPVRKWTPRLLLDAGRRPSCTRRTRRRQPGPQQPWPRLAKEPKLPRWPQPPRSRPVQEEGREDLRPGPQPPRSRSVQEEEGREDPRPGLVRKMARASASVLAEPRSAEAAIAAHGRYAKRPTWRTPRPPPQRCRAAPSLRVCAAWGVLSRQRLAHQSCQQSRARPPVPLLPGRNWFRHC